MICEGYGITVVSTGNTNSFLVKRRLGSGKQVVFSRDPLNLVNKHSRKYVGYVNDKVSPPTTALSIIHPLTSEKIGHRHQRRRQHSPPNHQALLPRQQASPAIPNLFLQRLDPIAKALHFHCQLHCQEGLPSRSPRRGRRTCFGSQV